MSLPEPDAAMAPAHPEPMTTLVKLARLGDDAAFEQLYLCRYRQICSFLIHLVGSEELGRDLTHDTFLKAWQELPRLRDTSCFDSWLYRIARNLAWNCLQQQKIVHWQSLPEETDIHQPELTVVTGFEQEVEERVLLAQALTQVAPQYRECVIFQVIEGMPQAAIASLLGISKESVSKYVGRGLEQLRRAYARFDREASTRMQED